MSAADAPRPDDGERTEAAPLADVFRRQFGGPLGVAESTLPAAAYVAVITAADDDTTLAGIVAVVIAAVFALARLVRRQTPLYALSGVLGVGIAAYIASRTGRSQDFFLPGLLLNIGYAAAWVISILVRWPLMGVLVSALTNGGTAWRRDPVRVRAFNRASWVWAGLFGLRVAVQLPLYLAGATVALGTARVGMGLPLFALGLWLSWLLLRETEGGVPRRPAPEPQ